MCGEVGDGGYVGEVYPAQDDVGVAGRFPELRGDRAGSFGIADGGSDFGSMVANARAVSVPWGCAFAGSLVPLAYAGAHQCADAQPHREADEGAAKDSEPHGYSDGGAHQAADPQRFVHRD
jgi:hypothetical protein